MRPLPRDAWLLRFVLPTLLVASVTGCGGSSVTSSLPPAQQATATPAATPTPSPTPIAVDACQLVTQDEASTLGGTPLLAGMEGNPSNPSCTYTFPPSGPEAQVSVFTGDGAKTTLDTDRRLMHTLTPVSGLADEAYEETNAIFLRKSTEWVVIEMVRLDSDPAQNRVPLEVAAAKVAARLSLLGF